MAVDEERVCAETEALLRRIREGWATLERLSPRRPWPDNLPPRRGRPDPLMLEIIDAGFEVFAAAGLFEYPMEASERDKLTVAEMFLAMVLKAREGGWKFPLEMFDNIEISHHILGRNATDPPPR